MIHGFIGFAHKKKDPDKILYTAIRASIADLYKWERENRLKIFMIKSLLEYQQKEEDSKE